MKEDVPNDYVTPTTTHVYSRYFARQLTILWSKDIKTSSVLWAYP